MIYRRIGKKHNLKAEQKKRHRKRSLNHTETIISVFYLNPVIKPSKGFMKDTFGND
jgi:hypothetical protein